MVLQCVQIKVLKCNAKISKQTSDVKSVSTVTCNRAVYKVSLSV